MKLSIRYFALVVMGAFISGCAEETEDVQPSASGTVRMKTTVSLDERASTRALDADGKKTFAAGDQIAFLTGDKFLDKPSGRAERLSGFSMRA